MRGRLSGLRPETRKSQKTTPNASRAKHSRGTAGTSLFLRNNCPSSLHLANEQGRERQVEGPFSKARSRLPFPCL